jgi:hypothetical protein
MEGSGLRMRSLVLRLWIDITAEELKRQTFTVPLILNLVVAAVIGLRVYMGIQGFWDFREWRDRA